ncbi:hypothetical protein B5F89_05890 [Collinsella sp. An307]|nr:hypothetical protein B5F89_05890 [Collinsella sp. An307]
MKKSVFLRKRREEALAQSKLLTIFMTKKSSMLGRGMGLPPSRQIIFTINCWAKMLAFLGMIAPKTVPIA